ncbi:MAG: pyrroline-5-carboxylate reductase [Legionellales bacterium]|nr:pyrroline-5-carboxylate reductase [Legionellales bacterium]
MLHPNIAFIGAGNMGSSLIGGLHADGYDPQRIYASNSDPKILEHLKQRLGIHVTADNAEAVSHADVIVLAIKPQVMKNVVEEIKEIVTQKNKCVLISIAAGIRIQAIEQWLGCNLPIVRCMPNTPALCQSGATALFANELVSPQQKNLAESILRSVGIVAWLAEEHLLDVITALSGSGPAYFFYLMECMQEAAINLGIAPEIAKLFTLQTGFGACKMALESDVALPELRKRVTSHGGTTEKALQVFVEHDFSTTIKTAIQQASLRAQELADLFQQ